MDLNELEIDEEGSKHDTCALELRHGMEDADKLLREWKRGRPENEEEIEGMIIADSEDIGQGRQLLLLADPLTKLAHFRVLHPDGHLGAVE